MGTGYDFNTVIFLRTFFFPKTAKNNNNYQKTSGWCKKKKKTSYHKSPFIIKQSRPFRGKIKRKQRLSYLLSDYGFDKIHNITYDKILLLFFLRI